MNKRGKKICFNLLDTTLFVRPEDIDLVDAYVDSYTTRRKDKKDKKGKKDKRQAVRKPGEWIARIYFVSPLTKS